MAGLTSVMQTLFGKAPVQNVQANPAVLPNQPNGVNNPTKMAEPQIQAQPGNGVIPAGAEKAPVSPLADYKELWEPMPVDPNAPKPVAGPSAEDIMKAAGKVDFAKILDPTQLAELAKGGEGATAALVALLNQASQASYGQSAVTASRLVNEALKNAKAQMVQEIPAMQRTQQAKENLFQSNPGFNDPAVKPMVEAVVAQLAERFPKASQSELESHAKKMLQSTAEVLNPTKTDPAEAQDDPNEDWSRYLDGQPAVFKR